MASLGPMVRDFAQPDLDSIKRKAETEGSEDRWSPPTRMGIWPRGYMGGDTSCDGMQALKGNIISATSNRINFRISVEIQSLLTLGF